MNLPADDFIIDDDMSAIALLTDLGLLGQFKSLGLTGQRLETINFVHHPTHWLVFCRFTGHSNPADNGFRVYGLLKAHATFNDFQFLVKGLGDCHGYGDTPRTEKLEKPSES